jgi:hypothetical protein
VGVLPIATLNSALPIPEILEGYEGPPLKSISFGFTQRIGAAAIIVPKTVNPRSFDRVLFWMQGNFLPQKDSAFLASLSAIAQMSGAIVLVIRTEQNVPVRERSRIYAAFVDAALKGGVTVYRNGTEEMIEIARDATYLLGGWSRGAMAAITIASRTVSGSKISTTRGRLKGIIAVGPGGLRPNVSDEAQLINSVLSEGAKKSLRGLDALFVISYADNDTSVQGAKYFSTFGSGPGRVVLLTATCQNHRKLLAMSPLSASDPLCSPELPGSGEGSFYTDADSPGVPGCALENLGPFWIAAVPSMFDYPGPNTKSTFDRLLRQEVTVESVTGVQVLARGSVTAPATKDTVVPVVKSTGEKIEAQEVKVDGAGLNLDGIIKYFAKATPLSTKGCGLLKEGGKIAGLGIGVVGTVFVAPAGKTISFTVSKPLPSWILGAEGLVRFTMGFVDLEYFSESAGGVMFPDQGPRTSRLRVCYQARSRTAAPIAAIGSFVMDSAPVYQRVRCGIEGSCQTGTQFVSQAGGRGWLVLQSRTMRLPPRKDSGIARFDFSFRPSRSLLVIVGPLEGLYVYD